MSRTRGSIHPLPHTSSCYRDNFTFTATDCNASAEKVVLQNIFKMQFAKQNEALVAKNGIT
jgi:hypothetical protein